MQQLKRFQAQLRTVLTAPTLTILTIPMTVPIIPVMILTIPEQTTTPVVMTAAMINSNDTGGDDTGEDPVEYYE